MKRTKAEVARIVKRANHLNALLGEFGAHLHGFDPGVTATLPGRDSFAGMEGAGCFGEALSFSHVAWEWLEPLLIELRGHRKAIRKEAMRVAKKKRKPKKAVKKPTPDKRPGNPTPWV